MGHARRVLQHVDKAENLQDSLKNVSSQASVFFGPWVLSSMSFLLGVQTSAASEAVRFMMAGAGGH